MIRGIQRALVISPRRQIPRMNPATSSTIATASSILIARNNGTEKSKRGSQGADSLVGAHEGPAAARHALLIDYFREVTPSEGHIMG